MSLPREQLILFRKNSGETEKIYLDPGAAYLYFQGQPELFFGSPSFKGKSLGIFSFEASRWKLEIELEFSEPLKYEASFFLNAVLSDG